MTGLVFGQRGFKIAWWYEGLFREKVMLWVGAIKEAEGPLESKEVVVSSKEEHVPDYRHLSRRKENPSGI